MFCEEMRSFLCYPFKVILYFIRPNPQNSISVCSQISVALRVLYSLYAIVMTATIYLYNQTAFV